MITVTVPRPTIHDSGERRTFDSGAVRDIQEGKGRPSLMPLRVVARMLADGMQSDNIVPNIAAFIETTESVYLYHTLGFFAEKAYNGCVETMILEAAIHFEMGAAKYGENNWQKGIPLNCYLDSAIRHYLKWRRGDTDEPHARAFVWNIMCCIWEVDYHNDSN